MYIPGDENSVDMDERLGNYDDGGNWIGGDPADSLPDYDSLRKAMKENPEEDNDDNL